MAEMRDTDAVQAVRSLRELAEDDSRLPQGDRTLRDILDFLKRLSSAADVLSNNDLAMVEGFGRFLGEGPRETLKRLCDDSIKTLGELRTSRIRAAKIDQTRLSNVAELIDRRLANSDGNIGIFEGFEIHRVAEDLPTFEWSVTGVKSAEFLTPAMADFSDTYLEAIGKTLSHGLSSELLWRDFFKLRFKRRRIGAAPDSERFWERVTELASSVGPLPALLLPHDAVNAFAETFIWGRRDDKPHGLEITGRDRERGHGYYAKVNGIEVFTLRTEHPNEAYLFSENLLGEICYHPLGDDGLIPAVAFFRDQEDPWRGNVKATIARSVTWFEGRRIKIRFDPAIPNQET